MMNRREFIVAGGAVAWPWAGRAQQAEQTRRIGVLLPAPEGDQLYLGRLTTLREALGKLGWVESRNLHIEYRWSRVDATLFRTHAAELVNLSPEVIVTTSTPTVRALRKGARSVQTQGVAHYPNNARRGPGAVRNDAISRAARAHRRFSGRVFTPLPDGLVVENLFDDHVVAAAGRHHPLARSRRLTLADLMEQRWILPPPNLTCTGRVLSKQWDVLIQVAPDSSTHHRGRR